MILDAGSVKITIFQVVVYLFYVYSFETLPNYLNTTNVFQLFHYVMLSVIRYGIE